MKEIIRIIKLPAIPAVDLKPHERWIVFPVLVVELSITLFLGFAMFSGVVSTIHGMLK